MTITQERRALELFEVLVDQPEAARTAILDSLLADDPLVAQRVAALLATHHADARRLPTEPPAPVRSAPDLPPPAQVGVYRITELLGRGGMGAVYRAERCDGLFEHVVAIKLMRTTHNSQQALQSFESERRHLARLQHPNIAQLYDGGDLPDGRAYIVIEWVDGRNLVDYVREKQLQRTAILTMFGSVCAAVQAAHQHLIVHADLKPSNIMVTQDGVAKLLDLGVSRLLVASGAGTQPTAGSSATGLTAAYASPERRRGEPPSITDDVYSLGMILRELLSEQGPTEGENLAALALPADLRAIIDKATAGPSSVRYGGINELVADLQRYHAYEPVSARAPTGRYRAQCFLRRHRVGAMVTGTMLLALIGALLVTVRLYENADAARLKADNRYAEVRQLSKYMLGDLQLQLTSLPQSLPLRKEIVARAERYMHSLAVDESAPLDVQLDAVAGLTQLAEMQGVPGEPNVGDVGSARQSLQRALQIAKRLRSDGVAPMQVALATARIGMDFATILVSRENDAKAAQKWLASSRRDLDAARAFHQDSPEAERLDIEWSLRSADLANWTGEYAYGARLARLAIDKLAAMKVTGVQSRNRAIALARAWDSLAEAIYYRGDYSDSLIPYQREVAIVDEAKRRFPDDTLVERNRLRAYWSLGTTYLQIKRNADALQALATATDIGKELSRQEPNDADVLRDSAIAYAAYGEALASVEQYAQAINILTATVQQRGSLARQHPEAAANLRDYAISLAALADVYLQSGDAARACQLYPQARAIHDRLRREGRSVALSEDYSVKHIDEAEGRSCAEDASHAVGGRGL